LMRSSRRPSSSCCPSTSREAFVRFSIQPVRACVCVCVRERERGSVCVCARACARAHSGDMWAGAFVETQRAPSQSFVVPSRHESLFWHLHCPCPLGFQGASTPQTHPSAWP
jgi:hypothetical protein